MVAPTARHLAATSGVSLGPGRTWATSSFIGSFSTCTDCFLDCSLCSSFTTVSNFFKLLPPPLLFSDSSSSAVSFELLPFLGLPPLLLPVWGFFGAAATSSSSSLMLSNASSRRSLLALGFASVADPSPPFLPFTQLTTLSPGETTAPLTWQPCGIPRLFMSTLTSLHGSSLHTCISSILDYPRKVWGTTNYQCGTSFDLSELWYLLRQRALTGRLRKGGSFQQFQILFIRAVRVKKPHSLGLLILPHFRLF